MTNQEPYFSCQGLIKGRGYLNDHEEVHHLAAFMRTAWKRRLPCSDDLTVASLEQIVRQHLVVFLSLRGTTSDCEACPFAPIR